MAIGQVLSNEPANDKYIDEYLASIKSTADATKTLKSTITLGEIGKRTDLSKKPEVIKIVSSLLGAPTEDIKTAASLCLGNICVGNP